MSPKKPRRAPGPRSSARTSSQIKGAKRSSTATAGTDMRDHPPRSASGDEYRGSAMQDDPATRREDDR